MDALEQALFASEAADRAALDRALSRIPSGPPAAERDCAACGDPIAPARLAALPAARLCIDCQREEER